MPVVRNRISIVRAGGPRQFTELRDRLLIRSKGEDEQNRLTARLDKLGYQTRVLDNAPILVAEPQDRFDTVLDKFRERIDKTPHVSDALDELRQGDLDGSRVIDAGEYTLKASQNVLDRVSDFAEVSKARFVFTSADYGPENLSLSPDEMDTVPTDNAAGTSNSLRHLHENLGVTDAWDKTRGENAIVAIFDTGFAEGIVSESRIVDKYHGPDADSVYAPAEGHGTMCAGAAAANKDEDPPMNGAAPDADVILVRITDSSGQIRSDYIAQAWDWLAGKEYDKPVVASHSYGTPLCNGRPRVKYCEDPSADMLRVANSDSNITSLYAAGNEAMTCGHRPSGVTNGITGQNSLAEVITVGALRFDGREAQRYSSHGRGDCAPIADPKPNCSCAIPMKTYYGRKEGWGIKDMSMGFGGSSGGTSHATPTTAGMMALVQSRAVDLHGEPLQTEELKRIIEDNSKVPHRNQINMFGMVLGESGWDSRFGHGQLDINAALDSV